MKTVFSIAADNSIAVSDSEAAVVGEQFRTEQQLAALAQKWPAQRLAALWNQLPGCKPVRKFTDRKTGVARIWRELQRAHRHSVAQPRSASKTKNLGNQGSSATCAPLPRAGTKTEKVLELLREPGGATVHSLMRATGWQAHSVRGFLSGHVGKKLGLAVESSVVEGERLYLLKN